MKCKGFSDKTTKWFHSYLTKRTFFASLGNAFSEAGTMNCGGPEGIYIWTFIVFVIYKRYSTSPIK